MGILQRLIGGSTSHDFWGVHPSLVGGLEHFLFSHILGIIIPIDKYFSEGFKPPTSSGGAGFRNHPQYVPLDISGYLWMLSCYLTRWMHFSELWIWSSKWSTMFSISLNLEWFGIVQAMIDSYLTILGMLRYWEKKLVGALLVADLSRTLHVCYTEILDTHSGSWTSLWNIRILNHRESLNHLYP